MLERLHKHSKVIFETDLGIIAGAICCALWIGQGVVTGQAVDMPSIMNALAFMMVFFIERAHSREMKAVHLKLDALLAAQHGASNRLIKVEDAPENVVVLAHQALHSLASEAEANAAISIDHTKFLEDIEKSA